MPITRSHYMLELKCDDPSHVFCGQGVFYGDSLGRTKKIARKNGWKFKADKTVLCSRCAIDEAKKRKKGRKKKDGVVQNV